MKRSREMKTMRTDIERDRKMTICKNSSWIGFSGSKLRYGDFFVTNDYRLGRCHGRVKPRAYSADGDWRWKILAQMAAPSMQWTGERWELPEAVIEVIPADRMHEGIIQFFDDHLTVEE